MKYIICILTLFVASCAVANTLSDNSSDAHVYVESLPTDCIYDDGYVCAEEPDPFFYSKKSQDSLVPAVYLQAWSAAYKKFLSLPELSDKQKELHHYKIGFADEGDDYVVLFVPLLLPNMNNGEPSGVSRVAYGKAVAFWVDKKYLRVFKHLYLK